MGSLIAASMFPDPNDRPTRPVVLSYLACILIASGGLYEAWVGTNTSNSMFGVSGWYLVILGVVGVVIGFIVLTLGEVGWYLPKTARRAGRAIIVLSVVSLVTSFFGFFFVGSALGIVSGWMTIRAKPRREAPPPDWRTEKLAVLPVYSSANEGVNERRP
ncbi:MAG: DUF6114 domain-containing protein [Thermoplasmata archaeon]